MVEAIFTTVTVEEQGLDPALAVLRLSRRYSPARLEAACAIALAGQVRSPRYAHLQPILATGQDKTRPAAPDPGSGGGQQEGGFVRGADYYAGGQW